MTDGEAKRPSRLNRTNLGFLLARASHHWNAQLHAHFSRAGYADVRPAFGAILVPLYEEDGLRLGDLASRTKLSKQTMTTMVRAVQAAGLVKTRPDPQDARATRVYLTNRARRFRPVAEGVLESLEREARKVAGSDVLSIVQDWLAQFAKL